VDQVVAEDCPTGADVLVADVVRHRRGPRGEQCDVDAALVHHPQLAALDRLADLVVADRWIGRGVTAGVERIALLLAPAGVRRRAVV